MQIEIITPDATIFTGEVSLAQFPGKDGSFEILNLHAPMVSVLKKGKIKIVDQEKQTRYFDVDGGIIEVRQNHIIVLAD
jgi:F-type H+-transporting ATPase subunit epsilon